MTRFCAWQVLSAALVRLPKLQNLDLSRNGLVRGDLVTLLQHVARCPTLSRLHIADNFLVPHDLQEVSRLIQECSQLLDIDLSGNYIGDLGAYYLAKNVFSNGSGPRSLVLIRCNIYDTGARQLARVLHTSTHLQRLNLADNHISESLQQELLHTEAKCLNLDGNTAPNFDFHGV